MAPQAGPGTKTFEIDQSFEPGARNRRPTIDVGGSEVARSGMPDEFDGLGATLNRCRVLAAKRLNLKSGDVADRQRAAIP